MKDPSFEPDATELSLALTPLLAAPAPLPVEQLPTLLPDAGLGEAAALALLAPVVLGGAQRLGNELAFAHMDPPTPWVTWVTTLWNASVNQNLLHPDVAPVARDLERRVIDWLTPAFGMDGGHMTPGSTIANITALWAARECRGVRRVVASEAAHLSMPKAAHILGLDYLAIPTDAQGAMDTSQLPADLSQSALVLTAGTTTTGANDPLSCIGRAAWSHVDAAWAGPLRLTDRYADRLAGVERADSVAMSGHKWLFQPKESGVVMFRETATAHAAISFGGGYLSAPNIGLLGSHGANAVPLLATLLAWGRSGLAERIEQAMALADRLHARLAADPRIELFATPATGVILWRAKGQDARALHARLPTGMTSLTSIAGADWLRQVAANPMADIDAIWRAIELALET